MSLGLESLNAVKDADDYLPENQLVTLQHKTRGWPFPHSLCLVEGLQFTSIQHIFPLNSAAVMSPS